MPFERSFWVDLDRNCVVISGERIPLNCQQTEFLFLLAQKANRVVSHDALWLGLYGSRPDSDQPSPDSHILKVLASKLRGKLRDVPGVEIVNHIGRGFELVLSRARLVKRDYLELVG